MICVDSADSSLAAGGSAFTLGPTFARLLARRILDDFRDFLGKFWLVKPKAASLESLADDLRRAA